MLAGARKDMLVKYDLESFCMLCYSKDLLFQRLNYNIILCIFPRVTSTSHMKLFYSSDISLQMDGQVGIINSDSDIHLFDQ